ncbi:MAG TPA: hypothetical protein VL899_17800 [Alphaproteobacteria bacterium]|jgi:hypothetical protein|nr:hypothetical protein [Alphaproteobacteria bacterium]
MKRVIAALGLAGLLAGCAPAAYGPPPAVGVGVAVGYDGFYDDYYGPFYDGYWARDNFFYYSRGPGLPYRRDYNRHFRRNAWNGFHPIRGHGPGTGPYRH